MISAQIICHGAVCNTELNKTSKNIFLCLKKPSETEILLRYRLFTVFDHLYHLAVS